MATALPSSFTPSASFLWLPKAYELQFGILEPKWPIARIQAQNPNAGPKEPKSAAGLNVGGQAGISQENISEELPKGG